MNGVLRGGSVELEAIRESIEANLASVRARIEGAADRVGRDPSTITLVTVSKTVEPERILLAHELGLRTFGENRVEEAETKIPFLTKRIQEADNEIPSWHLIGHLQSRKSARALALFDLIHSVDSVRLASRIRRQAGEAGEIAPILLEMNVSGESSKYGFPLALGDDDDESTRRFMSEVEGILALPWLDVRGLMTVAPIMQDPQKVRPYFRWLREWRDRLLERFSGHALPELSMGMTDDFEVAVEEGATLLRLGRAIFGPRPTH